MPQNVYELMWIFIIYAVIGWCTEVSYAALDVGVFVNRGFLNGPYCPIYGCGVVVVITILTPLKYSFLILFIGSVILTTALEYITGYLLEKVFHNKWWDYSNKPFNIKGYVCLKFSIFWGLACTFIMNIFHPMIYKGITSVPLIPGMILLSIFMLIFAVDGFVTVSTVLKFNKRLKLMDEIAVKIHMISNEIGETIYENVADAIEKSEEFQEAHAGMIDKLTEKKEDIMELPGTAKHKLVETAGVTISKITDTTGAAKIKITETTEAAKLKITDTTEAAKLKITDTTDSVKMALTENVIEAKNGMGAKKEAFAEKTAAMKLNREEKKREREELSKKYKELYENKAFGFKRLLKAFPNMKSRDNDESLQDYKKHFHIKNAGGRKNKNALEKEKPEPQENVQK